MPRRYFLFLAVVLVLVVLDQWTKYLVVGALTDQFDGRATIAQRLSALYERPPEEPAYGPYHWRPRGEVVLSDDFLRLRYAENPGAAWGMLRDLPRNVRGVLFNIITLGAIVLITWYFRRLQGTREEAWALIGLPVVLGGAIGNYIDRLSRSFVVDFVEAHWFDKPGMVWPSFNVADMAISVGVCCLLIDSFVRKEKPAPAQQPVSP